MLTRYRCGSKQTGTRGMQVTGRPSRRASRPPGLRDARFEGTSARLPGRNTSLSVSRTTPVLQNTISLWFFLTPIVYPVDAIPASLKWLYQANPATALILPFVDVFYRAQMPNLLVVATSAAWSCGLFVAGVLLFESCRNSFAQEI